MNRIIYVIDFIDVYIIPHINVKIKIKCKKIEILLMEIFSAGHIVSKRHIL